MNNNNKTNKEIDRENDKTPKFLFALNKNNDYTGQRYKQCL